MFIVKFLSWFGSEVVARIVLLLPAVLALGLYWLFITQLAPGEMARVLWVLPCMLLAGALRRVSLWAGRHVTLYSEHPMSYAEWKAHIPPVDTSIPRGLLAGRIASLALLLGAAEWIDGSSSLDTEARMWAFGALGATCLLLGQAVDDLIERRDCRVCNLPLAIAFMLTRRAALPFTLPFLALVLFVAYDEWHKDWTLSRVGGTVLGAAIFSAMLGYVLIFFIRVAGEVLAPLLQRMRRRLPGRKQAPESTWY